jgi:large subunit ribosomal protein L13
MTNEKKEVKKTVAKKEVKKRRNRNIMKTLATRPCDIKRKWYIVDATDLVLGRMASVIANYLRGKHKPYFSPSMDCGDYIIVINAEKIHLTGKKFENKIYYKHTGHPGGIKGETVKDIYTRSTPTRIIRSAVENMTKKRSCIGRAVMKKLFIYTGSEHPHTAQKPEKLDIASMNNKNTKRN